MQPSPTPAEPRAGDDLVSVYRGFTEPQLSQVRRSGGVIGAPRPSQPFLFVTPDAQYAASYGQVWFTQVPRSLYEQARLVFGLFQGTPVEEMAVPYLMRDRGWGAFFTGWRPIGP